jgi:hypothetical protein
MITYLFLNLKFRVLRFARFIQILDFRILKLIFIRREFKPNQ